MSDLHRRFATLDRVPAPDLWDTIALRAAAPGSVERVSRIATPAPKAPPRSTGRPLIVYLAAAAVLLALAVGALAVGSGIVRLPAVVPVEPPPAPSVAASPSATATASPAPSTAIDPWLTGQELIDALSAEHGYQWSQDVGPESVVSAVRSEPLWVQAPMDEQAWVEIGTSVDAAADDMRMHADRVAQALAPDATSWLREAIPATLAAGPGSTATMTTASGGEVGVRFVDEPLIQDWFSVWFRPPPPPTRALERSGGDVVYTEPFKRGGEILKAIWVVNADGTDAIRVRAGKGPAEGVSDVLGWSADGSRLFYQSGDSVEWIDASGSEPVQVARGLEQVTLSPDGTRLAYPIDGDPGRNTIGILDIATGQVTEVTFATDTGERACEGPFGGGDLQWSPDGTRFVFGNSVGPRVDGFCHAAIYTVASDGTGLRRLNPSDLNAMEPRWTPDGSILFDSPRPLSAPDGRGDLTAVPLDRDIYSVGPDGSGLTALTSDGVSFLLPSRTRDGRIVFTRDPYPDAEATGELWIMDADGSNPTPLDNTVAGQTAAGCLVCPYLDASGQMRVRYWQPMPGDQP